MNEVDIKKYKPVDFGNTQDLKDFFHIEIKWEKPVKWADFEGLKKPFIYAIINSHKNRKHGPEIQYVGITENGNSRFKQKDYEGKLSIGNYTSISVGNVSSQQKIKLRKMGRETLEQLEHIFIWALCDKHVLYNYKKQDTLPGWGLNGTEAYHITNRGFRFWQKMPREVIYPWILVRN